MEQIKSKTNRHQVEKTFYYQINKANKEFWRTLTKSLVAIFLTIFLLLGSCSIYDMIFPEIVPQIQHLGFRPEKAWVDHNLNQEFEPKDLSEFELWEDLQKALELLDLTCPEASDWVRDQHNNGNIIYDWEYDYTMARFDFLSRKLTLTSGFYQLREGEKATTLAHEYRHSIQNRTKFIKRIIFQLLTGKTHEYVVEDDADLFESRLYIALHG